MWITSRYIFVRYYEKLFIVSFFENIIQISLATKQKNTSQKEVKNMDAITDTDNQLKRLSSF